MAKCIFEEAVTLTSTILESAREKINEAKGTLSGDTHEGSFSIPSPIGNIEGIYTASGDILKIEISQKPPLISCNVIENEIKRNLYSDISFCTTQTIETNPNIASLYHSYCEREENIFNPTTRAFFENNTQIQNLFAESKKQSDINLLLDFFDSQEENLFDMATLKKTYWRNGRVLNVKFLNGDPAIQQKIIAFAKLWENYANIKFNFITYGNAEIRITMSILKLYESAMGTDALVNKDQSLHTMSLGFEPTASDINIKSVVLHEFGHCLGCIHEHQSPSVSFNWNKQKVYTFFQKNHGWNAAKVDFNIFKQYSRSECNASTFDKDSVMTYEIHPDWTNPPGPGINANSDLSSMDKFFIASIYPKKYNINLILDGKWERWYPTGVLLLKDQQVEISASGIIKFLWGGNSPFYPSGELNRLAGNGAPAPGLIANSLVAKAGGEPLYIGNRLVISAKDDCELLIASNDDVWWDNEGAWNVTINVK